MYGTDHAINKVKLVSATKLICWKKKLVLLCVITRRKLCICLLIIQISYELAFWTDSVFFSLCYILIKSLGEFLYTRDRSCGCHSIRFLYLKLCRADLRCEEASSTYGCLVYAVVNFDLVRWRQLNYEPDSVRNDMSTILD